MRLALAICATSLVGCTKPVPATCSGATKRPKPEVTVCAPRAPSVPSEALQDDDQHALDDLSTLRLSFSPTVVTGNAGWQARVLVPMAFDVAGADADDEEVDVLYDIHCESEACTIVRIRPARSPFSAADVIVAEGRVRDDDDAGLPSDEVRFSWHHVEDGGREMEGLVTFVRSTGAVSVLEMSMSSAGQGKTKVPPFPRRGHGR